MPGRGAAGRARLRATTRAPAPSEPGDEARPAPSRANERGREHPRDRRRPCRDEGDEGDPEGEAREVASVRDAPRGDGAERSGEPRRSGAPVTFGSGEQASQRAKAEGQRPERSKREREREPSRRPRLPRSGELGAEDERDDDVLGQEQEKPRREDRPGLHPERRERRAVLPPALSGRAAHPASSRAAIATVRRRTAIARARCSSDASSGSAAKIARASPSIRSSHAGGDAGSR